MKKCDLDYFNKGLIENPKFCSRFNPAPNFKNLKILDIGCGHGSFCIYAASHGAMQVIGIDIDRERINFANENLAKNYPHFRSIIKFQISNISDIKDSDFDIIVSKDSFEHILDVRNTLKEMNNRLKVGGRAYIGFGPLYNSFDGDHGRTKAFLPWGHLFFNEDFLLKNLNKRRLEKIKSIYELGLNKLSLSDYIKLFNESGMKILYFRVNVSNNVIMKLFSFMTNFQPLKEFFSRNLYCILQKK